MRKIVEVKIEPGFKVWIRFADGVSGAVDLSGMAGKGVFKAWDRPGFFASVFIDEESHTIAWPGGIDLCPDSLYDEICAGSSKASNA
ncbi:MAG: DUF2442 domain-containing protein [Deltaproteobacteria bacterium]|nr:DUF2442 domain-containing protein [Deltaproteobacteria bacterium]